MLWLPSENGTAACRCCCARDIYILYILCRCCRSLTPVRLKSAVAVWECERRTAGKKIPNCISRGRNNNNNHLKMRGRERQNGTKPLTRKLLLLLLLLPSNGYGNGRAGQQITVTFSCTVWIDRSIDGRSSATAAAAAAAVCIYDITV